MDDALDQLDMLDNLRAASVLGNSYFDYSLAAGYFIAGFFGIWIIKTVVLRHLKKIAEKTTTQLDDAVVRLTDSYVVPPLYFVIFYLSLLTLEMAPTARKILDVLCGTILTFYGIRFLLEIIKFYVFDFWIHRKKERLQFETQFRSLMPLVAFIIWGTGLVFLLDNLGVNISAVVTGLGIGGVAVALAASAILGDLFAYIAIMFDKPFILGDFIIVGDHMGTVEHIGIKTTHIRSLGGEQIIFSNRALTEAQVRNYKRMKKRRVAFQLGATYDTTLDKMKEIPELIKSIISKIPDTKFDRTHFYSYGDFSLNIEIVYYVMGNDYNKYMDIQQDINFKIKEEFEKRGIEFAFPTQTLHVTKT